MEPISTTALITAAKFLGLGTGAAVSAWIIKRICEDPAAKAEALSRLSDSDKLRLMSVLRESEEGRNFLDEHPEIYHPSDTSVSATIRDYLDIFRALASA